MSYTSSRRTGRGCETGKSLKEGRWQGGAGTLKTAQLSAKDKEMSSTRSPTVTAFSGDSTTAVNEFFKCPLPVS